MDTTDKYVDMCKAATELQDRIWKRSMHNGDFFWVEEFHKDHVFIFPCDANIYYEEEDKCHYVNGVMGKVIIGHNELVNQLMINTFGRDMMLFSCWVNNFYKYEDGTLNFVWLPRQDQLQEILSHRYDTQEMFNKFFEHYILYYSVRSDFWWQHTTMEQLWLSLVMYDKYKKTWNVDKKQWVDYYERKATNKK